MNTIEQQRPSGRRPEGLCHSISSSRAHDVSESCCFVPLLSQHGTRFRPLIDGSIAPDELYRTSYNRDAADGLLRCERYSARVSDESVLFPRHAPPRAGPRLLREVSCRLHLARMVWQREHGIFGTVFLSYIRASAALPRSGHRGHSAQPGL